MFHSRPPHGMRGYMPRMEVMNALGSVVYAARLADGTIKIGWTEHFGDRLRHLKAYTGQDVELLGFRFGGRDDEQAIHASRIKHRAQFTDQSREYYHPTAEVLALINEWRDTFGMSSVAA